MQQFCIEASEQIAGGIASALTVLITLASAFANFINPDTKLGKAVHFLALNIRAAKPAQSPPVQKG